MENTKKKKNKPWFQGWLLTYALIISLVTFNVSGQFVQSFNRINGAEDGGYFGVSSAGVYGDINGDNVNDMVVGAESESIILNILTNYIKYVYII